VKFTISSKYLFHAVVLPCGTLKTELEMTEYDHQRTARRIIGDYIAYYNLERKHSALGYLTPHQFETRLLQ
jgi:transposase InsO family protein